MAWGDTCGKIKLCFPKSKGVSCAECVSDTYGKQYIVDFNGDGPTTNCGIFGAPAIKLTSTAITGVLVQGPSDESSWVLGVTPITTDFIFAEAQQEGSGFGDFFSRVPLIESINIQCGIGPQGEPLIQFLLNMGIAQSPSYPTSGNPPPYDQWSVIQNSSYNLDYVDTFPYTDCDADYLASGATPSTVWTYLGTIPFNATSTV